MREGRIVTVMDEKDLVIQTLKAENERLKKQIAALKDLAGANIQLEGARIVSINGQAVEE